MSEMPFEDQSIVPVGPVYGRNVMITPPHTLDISLADLNLQDCVTGSGNLHDLAVTLRRAVSSLGGVGNTLQVPINWPREYTPANTLALIRLVCRYAIASGVLIPGNNTDEERMNHDRIAETFQSIVAQAGEEDAYLAFIRFLATYQGNQSPDEEKDN